MKEMVLAANRVGLVELSAAELGVLADVSYELSDQAKPRPRPRFVPIEQLTRFVHSLFGRLYGIDTMIPAGEEGWEQFRLHLESETALPIRRVLKQSN